MSPAEKRRRRQWRGGRKTVGFWISLPGQKGAKPLTVVPQGTSNENRISPILAWVAIGCMVYVYMNPDWFGENVAFWSIRGQCLCWESMNVQEMCERCASMTLSDEDNIFVVHNNEGSVGGLVARGEQWFMVGATPNRPGHLV
nr:hypothetical protein Iba_chr12fCG20750 [Ipomoea batatas]